MATTFRDRLFCKVNAFIHINRLIHVFTGPSPQVHTVLQYSIRADRWLGKRILPSFLLYVFGLDDEIEAPKQQHNKHSNNNSNSNSSANNKQQSHTPPERAQRNKKCDKSRQITIFFTREGFSNKFLRKQSSNQTETTETELGVEKYH